MDLGTSIASIVGVCGLILGGITLYKQLRSSTAADRNAAADRVAKQIADARSEEKERARDRINELMRDLEEIRRDRDHERSRADSLQQFINQGRTP